MSKEEFEGRMTELSRRLQVLVATEREKGEAAVKEERRGGEREKEKVEKVGRGKEKAGGEKSKLKKKKRGMEKRAAILARHFGPREANNQPSRSRPTREEDWSPSPAAAAFLDLDSLFFFWL